jgi:hypothetical protein
MKPYLKLKTIFKFSLHFLFIFTVTYAFSSKVESAQSGDWTIESSWNGAKPTLNTPDTVIINFGDTITIPSGQPIQYNGVLIVYGVLVIHGRLVMDENSSIQFAPGSDLLATGPGDSDMITIGNSTIKGEEINAINTPNQLIESSLTGGGCAETGNCDGDPLPIILYGFKAEYKNKFLNLTWSTISEQNFDYFAIERSHNAKNYVQIGTVKGSGWSQSRIDYSFTDHNPMPGINYYRLKSVDFDGYTEIFPPISVFNDNVQVSVKSPVIGKRLVLYSNMQGKAQLVNLFGGSVQSFDIDNGPNELALPGSLPRGLYILVVSNEGHLVKKTKIYVE